MVTSTVKSPALHAKLFGHEHWDLPLSEFAATTGLAVTLYDREARICSGPHTPTAFTSLLAEAGFWDRAGVGFAEEGQLIDICLLAGHGQSVKLMEVLEARAVPAVLGERIVGFFVIGWVPFEFTDPLSSERLAKRLNVATHDFWQRIRQQLPVADVRFVAAERMLKIIAGALLRQLEYRATLELYSSGLQILNEAAHQMSESRTPEEIGEAASFAVQKLIDSSSVRVLYAHKDHELRVIAASSNSQKAVSTEVACSVVSIPVQAANHSLLGLLEISHERSGEYGCEEEIKPKVELRALASQMAVALQKVRLIEDLSQERRRLDATVEELKRLARLRDEFLATISHELRTPLNAIVGWSQLFCDGELHEQDKAEAMAVISRNAMAQARIIEDLLDTSKIITGKMVIDPCLDDVVDILRNSVQTVRPAADAKSIVLEVSMPSNPQLLYVDAVRLQQVFWNLLSNAIKFTPAGGRISVVATFTPTNAVFEIKDSGKGITPDFLPYVFDRFSQEDGAITRRFGGLGLGLAIVRHLIEMHGGKVKADSRGEGFGATFSITLPRPQHAENVGEHQDASAALFGQWAKPLGDLVAVIFDDSTGSKSMAAAMAIAGAQVKLSHSLDEALKIVEQEKPDVVIIGIDDAREEGYQLLKNIRSLPVERGASTPAFALSLSYDDCTKVKAIRAGFERYYRKPVEGAAFVESLQEWLK